MAVCVTTVSIIQPGSFASLASTHTFVFLALVFLIHTDVSNAIVTPEESAIPVFVGSSLQGATKLGIVIARIMPQVACAINAFLDTSI